MEEMSYHSMTLDTCMAQVGRESAFAGSCSTVRATGGPKGRAWAEAARERPAPPASRADEANLRPLAGFGKGRREGEGESRGGGEGRWEKMRPTECE